MLIHRKSWNLATHHDQTDTDFMTTTLITGANKGLGFETARQLIAAGHTSTSAAGMRNAGSAQPRNSVPDWCNST